MGVQLKGEHVLTLYGRVVTHPSFMKDPQIEKIHAEFSEYGQNAKEWLRKCQMLLPLVAKYEIWRKKNFGSIYEYAAKLAGMGRSSVDTALWTLRKIEDKPALLKLAEEKGIHSVRPVANIATLETQDFWAKKAGEMSVRTLETYVRESKKSLHVAKAQPDSLDVTLTLKPESARRLEQLKKHQKFEECFEKMLRALENELEKDKPEAVKTSKRPIPAQVKRHVVARTRGLCEFPGCSKPYKILHHTQRWALENIHDPDRIVPLCKEHERLAHHGLIGNEQGVPYTWFIKKEPDRSEATFWIDQMVSLYR